MRSVLIVDDNAPNLALYAKALQRIPNVTTTGMVSAVEALEWAGLHEPHVVILDYHMPDIDGVEFTRRLREIPAHNKTPIIMLTGRGDDSARRAALSAGVDVYLTKPVDPAAFLGNVSAQLDIAATQRQRDTRVVDLASQLATAHQAVHDAERTTLEHLRRLQGAVDPSLETHAVRVAELSVRIAREMGEPQDEIQTIEAIVPLTDVGMLAVDPKIHRHGSRLEVKHREAIQRHTEEGKKLLERPNAPLLTAAADLCWMHHERMDGSGYPRGLKGEHIPMLVRIVMVADVFSAMTAHRHHRPPISVGFALQELERGAGVHYDARVVGAFRRVQEAALSV